LFFHSFPVKIDISSDLKRLIYSYLLQSMYSINVYTDGGARGNPGPAAIGAVIKTEPVNKTYRISQKIGLTTNNDAEYQAVLAALTFLKDSKNKLGINEKTVINFYSDSTLIVNQIKGLFKIKQPLFKEYILKIRYLEKEIKTDIYYHAIPREKNWEADRLVNLALDG